MVICIHFGEFTHCYEIVEIPWPWGPPVPWPNPHNYPQLFRDATIVASLQSGAAQIADPAVRTAIEAGCKTAVEALQKRGGDHVRIKANPRQD